MSNITITNDTSCLMTERDATNTIPFHRHCQATVLSAYGPEGKGATWGTILGLTLDNLPSDWKTFFTRNKTDITQDLASILELINQTTGKEKTITFKFGSSVSGGSVTVLGSDKNPANITIPLETVRVNFNSEESGRFTALGQDNITKTVSIQQDYNYIPATDGSISSTKLSVIPQKEYHIYKYSLSNTSPVTISIDLSKYSNKKSGIVAFECHITNNGSSDINISNIEAYKYGINNLTDLLTIKPDETNVYVFRMDLATIKLTYSLAYIIK